MSNDRKPDFSNVQSGANSKPADAGNKPLAGARPDFCPDVSADTFRP